MFPRFMILAAALALSTSTALAGPTDTKTADSKTVRKESTVSITAVVDAIDYKTREVTLDAPKGKFTVVVGDAVKNLDKIKKGDSVSVAYHEGILAEVRTPTADETARPYQEALAGGVGGAGKPGGEIGRQIKDVTTVVAIDKAKHEITFKGPRGNTETLTVEDPKNLDKVKVGDTVVFTYTEAVAIAVTPAPKPKK